MCVCVYMNEFCCDLMQLEQPHSLSLEEDSDEGGECGIYTRTVLDV